MRNEMTTHRTGGYVVHAESGWNNGNSPVGIALAVRLHKSGNATPSHVVHAAGETCRHCGPATAAQSGPAVPRGRSWASMTDPREFDTSVREVQGGLFPEPSRMPGDVPLFGDMFGQDI
jgi:hypothetical protein